MKICENEEYQAVSLETESWSVLYILDTRDTKNTPPQEKSKFSTHNYHIQT